MFEDDEGGKEPACRRRTSEATAGRRRRAVCPRSSISPIATAKTRDVRGGQPGCGVWPRGCTEKGITQVVGYYGPIVDELSTQAEVALYAAIADGQTTRFAVRQAREAPLLTTPRSCKRPGHCVTRYLSPGRSWCSTIAGRTTR